MKINIMKIFNEANTNIKVNESMINIKASTEESLGFIGEGRGVTCYCMSSLKEF
jgi:2C-methyl-D-erythritol 2,4-cyclodiphosphate synthase